MKSSASMDKRGASPPERVENDETAPGDEDWPTSTGHFVWLLKPLVHPPGSTTLLLLEDRGACDRS